MQKNMEPAEKSMSVPPPLPPENEHEVPPAPPSPPLPEQMSSESSGPLEFEDGSAEGNSWSGNEPPMKRARTSDPDSSLDLLDVKKMENFELHIIDEAEGNDDDDDGSAGCPEG